MRPRGARIGFLRAPVAGSPLVRLLGEWTPVDAQASGMDFAAQLSLWLNAFDAIGLQAAHQAIRAKPAIGVRARLSLEEDLKRVRGILASSIAKAIPGPDDADAGFTPYRDRHVELQRQMELMIGPLRAHVREAAGRQSPRLRQLAALDTAMEQVLAAREHALWPRAPALLNRRFEQQRASAAGDDDKQGWLQAFGREWRQALLAELDVRLAPVAGLVEAAANERDDTR
jgi:hypothetical protein